MSAPNTNTKVIPFNQRLELVALEINKRLSKVSHNKKPAIRARLWCKWLAREVSL